MTVERAGPNGGAARGKVRRAGAPAGKGPDAIAASIRHGCVPFVKRG